MLLYGEIVKSRQRQTTISSTLDGSDEVYHFENGRNVVVTVESEDQRRDRDSGRVHTKILSEFKNDVGFLCIVPLKKVIVS